MSSAPVWMPDSLTVSSPDETQTLNVLEDPMIYLIEPNAAKPLCPGFCSAFCHIKPMYGIPPIEV